MYCFLEADHTYSNFSLGLLTFMLCPAVSSELEGISMYERVI